MSLIYTNGFLKTMLVNAKMQVLEKNIKDILIIPPNNNSKEIIINIYEYDPEHAIYSLHLLQEPIFLEGVLLQPNVEYRISTNREDYIYIYYEKEENNNE